MSAVPVQEGPSDDEVPGILIEAGWRQGTILRVPDIKLWSVASAVSGQSLAHETPSDGRYVVVSQSCDIAAPIVVEPFVEVLACSVQPEQSKRASLNKSFRWFEIDPNEGLIAHAMYRIPIDKRALLGLTPEAWPSSADRRRQFATWLSRRASRSAIPQPVVDTFVTPLKTIVDELRRRQKDLWNAFNSEVSEIRLGLPDSEVPPFEIHVMFLLETEALSSQAANAIDFVRESLEKRLDPAQARLGSMTPTSAVQLSVETYFRTSLLELEHLSYSGGEVTGATPPGAV